MHKNARNMLEICKKYAYMCSKYTRLRLVTRTMTVTLPPRPRTRSHRRIRNWHSDLPWWFTAQDRRTQGLGPQVPSQRWPAARRTDHPPSQSLYPLPGSRRRALTVCPQAPSYVSVSFSGRFSHWHAANEQLNSSAGELDSSVTWTRTDTQAANGWPGPCWGSSSPLPPGTPAGGQSDGTEPNHDSAKAHLTSGYLVLHQFTGPPASRPGGRGQHAIMPHHPSHSTPGPLRVSGHRRCGS
jgi:hypothetical protein